MSIRYKYPKTPHLPWSNWKNDDRVIEDINDFYGKIFVMSVKMDGENTTLYRDYYHARSIDGRNHPSRNYAKQIHASICHKIPEKWRVCCENLYAKHSIGYNNLRGYLYGLSVWDEKNNCLDAECTEKFFKELGLPMPEIVVIDLFDPNFFTDLISTVEGAGQEGYVIRNVKSFHYSDFHKNVAKYVRKNHVQTDEHWMTQPIVRNGLRKELPGFDEYWRSYKNL